MAQHQQKLVHIHDVTSAAAAGAVAIATGFLINSDNNPSLAVARQECTCEVNGADPSANFRWWLTAITTAGFTFNWAGCTAGNVCNLHVVAHVYHSICFDISSAVSPY